MRQRILQPEALYEEAAREIRELIGEKPDAVIAMAAGRTMIPLYEKLAETDFSGVSFFQVAEFLNCPEDRTLRAMTALPLSPENCFWLTEETVQNFDRHIEEAGGLDLIVLGIGDNAHIGLNEPATQFDTRCRRQKLTEKTRNQYSWRFAGEEQTPQYGLTMGIRTICEAKRILVLAVGAEKTKAVFDMFYARNDSVIPAAFLQIPADVTVYADPEAAAKL